MFKPSDFSRTVKLGNVGNVVIGGVNREKFIPSYSLHFKQQKRTLSQQYQLVGTRLDETITIITRHDERNETATMAQIGLTVYDVIDVSPDDGGEYIRYDYLTLKQVKVHWLT